jgi:hypothetical protein
VVSNEWKTRQDALPAREKKKCGGGDKWYISFVCKIKVKPAGKGKRRDRTADGAQFLFLFIIVFLPASVHRRQ